MVPLVRGSADARTGAVGSSALLLASVAVHLLLYVRSLSNFFTFDDRAIVLDSPLVRGAEPLGSAFGTAYFGTAYRPATLMSLGLDVRLFGPSAPALRLENILWAGIGAWLFALLIRRLGASPAVLWATLLLTCVHPVRSEAILSIVGRSELLSFAFVTSALLTGLASAAAEPARRLRFSLVSAGCLAVALLSKENAFAAPFLFAVAAAFDPRAPRAPRAFAPVAAAWAAAFALVFAARHAVLGGFVTLPATAIRALENPLALLPGAVRLGAATAVLPTGFARLLWPRTLAADYGSNSFAVADLLRPGAVAAGSAALAGALVLLAIAARRAPLAAFGIAWVLAWWLPFANLFFATQVAFTERILFASAAGVALAGVAAAWTAGLSRGLLAAAVLAAAVPAVVRLERRIPEWRDDRTLFEATVRDVPGNGRAWANLAVLALGARDDARAAAAAQRAAAADPSLCPRLRGFVSRARSLGREETARLLDASLAGCPPP